MGWCTMHKPECPGHTWLEPYEIHEDWYANFSFDTESEAEYPWDMCVVFAGAVADEFSRRFPEPCGVRALTLDSLIYHELKGATRGLQHEGAARLAVKQVVELLDSMDQGQEPENLRVLLA